jgi:predicted O-methyltransferase YrrM
MIAISLLYERFENPVILETGTIRFEDDYGAGYSTYIFGDMVNRFGGELITVDIDKSNIELCKHITSKFSKNISYINDNSLEFLSTFNKKIDLLYLDSYDCPIEGDATESQKHNLHEFSLAEKNLNENSIILIDDVNLPNGGKAKLTHEYLSSHTYKKIYEFQQSVWSKLI